MRQVDGAVAPALADKKAKTANKRKGPHQPTMTKLLADCETLLGHYLMSTITGDSPKCIQFIRIIEPAVLLYGVPSQFASVSKAI